MCRRPAREHLEHRRRCDEPDADHQTPITSPASTGRADERQRGSRQACDDNTGDHEEPGEQRERQGASTPRSCRVASMRSSMSVMSASIAGQAASSAVRYRRGPGMRSSRPRIRSRPAVFASWQPPDLDQKAELVDLSLGREQPELLIISPARRRARTWRTQRRRRPKTDDDDHREQRHAGACPPLSALRDLAQLARLTSYTNPRTRPCADERACPIRATDCRTSSSRSANDSANAADPGVLDACAFTSSSLKTACRSRCVDQDDSRCRGAGRRSGGSRRR